MRARPDLPVYVELFISSVILPSSLSYELCTVLKFRGLLEEKLQEYFIRETF